MRIKNIIVSLKMPKKFDVALQAAVLILIAFGTLMIISTNAGKAGGLLVLVKVILKQMAFVVFSYVLMTFFANNFTMTRAKKLYLYAGLILLGLLAFTLVSKETFGSKAWIQIPIPGMEVTLQPSEFAKIFMVVIMAVYVELAGRKNYDFWTIVRIPVIFFIVFFVIILFQRDLGTMLVLTMITIICFLIPTHRSLRKAQRTVKLLLIVGTVCTLFLMSETGSTMVAKLPVFKHVSSRVDIAIDPFQHPHGVGYQLTNGLYGSARGGITGVGFGSSIQKYGYLTQSDNDFILSIVVEELGVFGLGIVVIGYLLILQRLFYYAFHTQSEGYKIILIGTGMYIFVHFVLNVGGVSGLIPLTGVPLLFISSGGSSLMSIMSAIGISQGVISRIRRQGSVKVGVDKKRAPRGRDSLRKGRGETKIGG